MCYVCSVSSFVQSRQIKACFKVSLFCRITASEYGLCYLGKHSDCSATFSEVRHHMISVPPFRIVSCRFLTNFPYLCAHNPLAESSGSDLLEFSSGFPEYKIV